MMLSRVASNLYWTARYMERSDYLARLLQVAQRMSTMTTRISNEWESALVASGCMPGYLEKYDEVTAEHVFDYLVHDTDNSSSIFSCLTTARNNARSVRAGISADIWDVVNSTWLELRQFRSSDFSILRLQPFITWTKQRGSLFVGAYTNTMMRGESYEFTELGTFLERADNTARIMDVKYHVLLPETDQVGGLRDYYQWTAILQSVAALRAYHRVYSGRIKPINVAELLIMRPEIPRSLRYCASRIHDNLEALSVSYGGSRGKPHRLAGTINARLQYGQVDEVFQKGLHEYLTEFIEEIGRLGEAVGDHYLS